jgi:hypothetical protein
VRRERPAAAKDGKFEFERNKLVRAILPLGIEFRSRLSF